MGRRIPPTGRWHVRALARIGDRRDAAAARRRHRDPARHAQSSAPRADRVSGLLRGRPGLVSLDGNLRAAGWFGTARRAADRAVLAAQSLDPGRSLGCSVPNEFLDRGPPHQDDMVYGEGLAKLGAGYDIE